MPICKYCEGSGRLGLQQEGCYYCSGQGYIETEEDNIKQEININQRKES